MTLEEKAKAYDIALDKVKMLLGTGSNCSKEELEYVFAELKESEDEKIRKEMIEILKKEAHDFPSSVIAEKSNSWLAWLEKHCEQKPADKVEPKFKVGDWIVNNQTSNIYIVKEIRDDEYRLWPLDGIIEGYLRIIDVDTEYHLWTIQDAKDGDVLCCESGWTCIFKALDNHTNTFSSYCFMDSDKWFCNTGGECHTLDKAFIKAYNGEIHPAVKEQCDLLFQKMYEAGYEWDAEKKELKKVEQKPNNTVRWTPQEEHCIRQLESIVKEEWRKAENIHSDVRVREMTELMFFLKTLNPNKKLQRIISAEVKEAMYDKPWDEEDEAMLNRLIGVLDGTNKEDYHEAWEEKFLPWLKSLKDRYTWKPSDEQMRVLDLAINGGIYHGTSEETTLLSLFNDLKDKFL